MTMMKSKLAAWVSAGLLAVSLAACDTAEDNGVPGPTLPPLATESDLPTAVDTVVPSPDVTPTAGEATAVETEAEATATSEPEATATTEATATLEATATAEATAVGATDAPDATATTGATATAAATGTTAAAASPGGVVNASALIDQGEDVYLNNCSTCHRPSGEGAGGTFPALAGNEMVTAEDPVPVINQVLHGGGGMPAFASQLTDRQVAAVVSYIRNAWGNDASVVPPEQVEEVQAASQ